MTRFRAVVIGASAGGMDALATVLPMLPVDFCLPIIIVQHRKAEHESFLEEYLDGKCLLNVVSAKNNDSIVANKVYISPGGYHLKVESGCILSLSTDVPVKFSIPSIDVLFTSAANIYKQSLIGIILTGANSDGSNGLKKIREMGGLAIVQDPLTADTPTMPENAINIAGVDNLLPLGEISSLLVELSHV